jgi:hypothetical protein
LQHALTLKPNFSRSHVNLAMLWLLKGNFDQGWPAYEWRWQFPECQMPSFEQPLWDGSALAGRTILLHCEQGLGDTLQFIRYAPLVQERGGRVVVWGPAALLSLLATCPGVAAVVDREDAPPHFDVHAPLLSLPRLLGTTLAAVPAHTPYLFVDAERNRLRRQEVSRFSGFKIGIAWQGNPKHPGDRFRSVPLTLFEPLARLPGVQLISLQKGAGVEQLPDAVERFAVTELSAGPQEPAASFQDTAAVLASLDLIVTIDSAVAHLAGALGLPVWVALPFAPDFRWMLHREDSPWYPTMRLFRQSQWGNWQEVFERITHAVKERTGPANRGPAPGIWVGLPAGP